MKQTPLSSPGLTGRPSIPEAPAITPRSHGVLDRPVIGERKRRRPSDGYAGRRQSCCGGRLAKPSFFLGALLSAEARLRAKADATKQSIPRRKKAWIASRSLS